jgi:hypothetical protein
MYPITSWPWRVHQHQITVFGAQFLFPSNGLEIQSIETLLLEMWFLYCKCTLLSQASLLLCYLILQEITIDFR